MSRAPRRPLTANRWGPARLAGLVAIAVAVLAVTTIALRSDGTYQVTAVFDDVRGLIDGGEVKAGGVGVGKVTNIAFTDDGMPEVQMSIDSDFRLRQGAFANIRLASNIGVINRFVDLTQGNGPVLADGATLGPSKTDQPVDLDLAVSTLDPRTRAQAGRLLAEVDAALRERGPEIAETIRHSSEALGETANLLGEVTADQRALSQLVTQGRIVVGALAESPEDIGETAERLATTLDAAAARQGELSRTAAAIGPGLASAHNTLEQLGAAVPDLRDLVEVARPVVAELAPTASALRPAMAALRPLTAEARRLAAPLHEQLQALRPVIAAALPVVKDLPGVLDGLTPLLDHLRARAPEVIGFFTLLGDATSDYDVNGNLVRVSALPIQVPRHTNEIDASSDAAGSVVRPFDRNPGAAVGEPWKRYWRSFIGGGRPPRSYLDDSEDHR
jgi:phospholipid/cholesterol/gamma-HCH transport system substrate-binding protein